MPPTVEDRLQDILEAIGEIQGLMQGVGFDQFTSDRHKRLLIERFAGNRLRGITNDSRKHQTGGAEHRLEENDRLRQCAASRLSYDQGRTRLEHRPKSSAPAKVVRRTPHSCVRMTYVSRNPLACRGRSRDNRPRLRRHVEGA
jgi:hypothetical protein